MTVLVFGGQGPPLEGGEILALIKMTRMNQPCKDQKRFPVKEINVCLRAKRRPVRLEHG